MLVRYSTGSGIATFEMSNPPANTYTYQMMQEMDEAVLEARMDPAVHIIVMHGGPGRFFSAGADIQMLADADPQYKYAFCLHANETLLRLENTPKLVIAALNGHTVGGDLEIALACDLRIARRDSGRIGLPEVNLGVLPGTGGTQRLTRTVGKSRAMELIVTGRTISFEEAHEMGMIHHIFEPVDFLEQVMDYAQDFVPPRKASMAVGLIKRAVCAASELPLAEGLAVERELQQRLFSSPDAAAGLRAWLDKEVAQFKGP